MKHIKQFFVGLGRFLLLALVLCIFTLPVTLIFLLVATMAPVVVLMGIIAGGVWMLLWMIYDMGQPHG